MEFAGLKTLQDFKVPAVRAAAFLSGYRFGDRKGDAVITHGLADAIRLDEIFFPVNPGKRRVRAWPQSNDADAEAYKTSLAPSPCGPPPNPLPTYRDRKLRPLFCNQLIDLLKSLAEHNLGHTDLRLSSFLWSDEKLYFCDAVALKQGGLKTDHLMSFTFNAAERATRSDRMRIWRALVPNADVPPEDKKIAKRIRRELKQDAIEKVKIGGWIGRFRSRSNRIQPWSSASRLNITPQDWQREWPRILSLLRADQLDILKRDPSGDVLATTITLAGVPIDAIVKQPRNKFWYRYVYDAFRSSRAMRLWQKARWLQVRQIAVEYPLLVMERKQFGYVVESISVFEKVPGPTLDEIDLDALTPADRETLFRRCGRVLRKIEDTGLTHTDAKASNWIIVDETIPVLIDAYGLRPLNAFLQLFGIRRLLRAMRKHPQYTPTDSRHICQGFAPRAPLEVDDAN